MTWSIGEVILELEIPPSEGAFLLGLGLVGDPLSLAGVGPEWTPVTGDLVRLSVVRGGAQSGVLTTLATGILTAELLGWSIGSAWLVPNRPIRLTTIEGEALFVGRVLDVTFTDGRATLLAVDAIAALENTRRQGAVAPGAGYEPWADRVERLATSSPVPIRIES